MSLPQLVTDEDIRTTESEIASRVGVIASQEFETRAPDFRLALEDRIAPMIKPGRPSRAISETSIIAAIVLFMAVTVNLLTGSMIPALWMASPAAVWIVLSFSGLLQARKDLSRILVLMQFAICLHPLFENGTGLAVGVSGLALVGLGTILSEGLLVLRETLETDPYDGAGAA